MPELPEVETTIRGITPHLVQQAVTKVIIRAPKLRWAIPKQITNILPGQKVHAITRRAKYMLLDFGTGTLIIHLGMSGRLQTLFKQTAPGKHDHVDIEFANGCILRYTDPRRFGCMLWTTESPLEHDLLRNLGPEPFAKEFSAKYLHACAQTRSVPVKNFIMDSGVVVGVGNIYASEALFAAKINPLAPAKTISADRYAVLISHIQAILKQSIKKGGTTLKDFRTADGKPGYFKQELQVYGRAGESCVTCGSIIQSVIIGQRNTFYCPECQPS